MQSRQIEQAILRLTQKWTATVKGLTPFSIIGAPEFAISKANHP